ncbi:MAG: triose-phosphate isomerase [Gammaproteobacteria bacterium]|nr:triose-phosphate isomerase [Gammaproteobacteria bacterium]
MNGARAFAATLCADIAAGLSPRATVGDTDSSTPAAANSAADSAVDAIADSAADSTTAAPVAEIVICPPHVLIAGVVDALAGSAIQVGAQDVDAADDGAFTGQTSARMLADAGCGYVIVGHSERRALYAESDELAARKAVAALAFGLRPILCVGETRAQREAGDTEAVLGRQVDALLAALDGVDAKAQATRTEIVIAYEPVWAIGTGLTATPAQAQDAHHFIRARLAAFDARLADCRIVYGGSMKPGNAAGLLAQPDIDGGLIGGASLNAADFLAICKAATVAAAAGAVTGDAAGAVAGAAKNAGAGATTASTAAPATAA